MTRLLPLSLLALALAGVAAPAHAIDEDRFVLRASAFNGDGRLRVAGNTPYLGNAETFDETFDTGRDTVPALDAQWRLGDRHRLVFNYTRFDGEESATLGEEISFDDVVIPAGSSARADAEMSLGGVAYDFAVVEAPTVSWGLQLGVQEARVEGRLRAVSGANTYDRSDSESGLLPLVGTRLTFAPSENWRVNAQVQHLDAGWLDSDDIDGKLTQAHAIVEYRFGGRFGVHAGYKWMRLDLQDRDGDEGINRFEQRFNGPVAGVTIAF